MAVRLSTINPSWLVALGPRAKSVPAKLSANWLTFLTMPSMFPLLYVALWCRHQCKGSLTRSRRISRWKNGKRPGVEVIEFITHFCLNGKVAVGVGSTAAWGAPGMYPAEIRRTASNDATRQPCISVHNLRPCGNHGFSPPPPLSVTIGSSVAGGRYLSARQR